MMLAVVDGPYPSRRIRDKAASFVQAQSQRRMAQGWSLAAVVLTMLLAFVNFYVFVTLRGQIVERETSQLQQIVEVTGAAVEQMFANTRTALESIRSNVDDDTSPKETFRLLKTTADAVANIRALSIVDVDGTFVATSRSFPPPRINLSNSPALQYFSSLAGAEDSLFMSGPALNSIDHQWQVLVAVPVRNQKGDVARVIGAVIDPKAVYSELLFYSQSHQGELTLVDDKFRLIASNPWRDDSLGTSQEHVPVFKRLLASNAMAATGIIDATDTQESTIAATRWLSGGRLALSASRSLYSVLRDWRMLSTIVVLVSAAILLLLAIAAFMSIRLARRSQQQNAALFASDQRFRLLMDSVSTHAIFMVDNEGRVTNWNLGAARVKGYSADAIIGSHIRRFYTPEDRAAGLPELAIKVARNEGIFTGEGIRVRADGSRFWASVVITPIHDLSGRQIGFANVTRDITEAHDINKELEKAKEHAEKAGAAKADFLANMSHEIRTPLNGIIGYADLALEDKNMSGETRQHVNRIFEASNSLRVIIDDILDFSKIESRGVELQPQPFDIRVLADNCSSIIRPHAEEKGLNISLSLDYNLPEALIGDAPRLRQVLINLMNNAVKFTDEGSVTLRISCSTTTNDNAILDISVRDTGIGISPEDQGKLFQRFNQADSSISRRFGGTGLGLAISQCIVGAMKGQLAVRSELGQGSSFYFQVKLPIASQADSRTDEHEPSESVKLLRILSVDDIKMNRDLCQAILSRAGHHVTTAESGRSAVALAKTGNFDIILMDVQMPDMDGLEATRQIRTMSEGKDKTPIIALTANVMPDQVQRYKAAGMDDHVGKPIVKEELLKTLSKWTKASDSGVPSTAKIADIPVHDREMFEDLLSFASPEMAAEYADNLRSAITNLQRRWDIESSGDREQMRGAAHQAIALAGQLGFAQLAEAYRTLERACLEGQLLALALEQVEAAVILALPEIEKIKDAA